MDQAMVKRGIGAVVLAIIAALLLGYLLKGKSRDRQEVIDTPVADVSDLIIPDLGGDADAPNSNVEASADGISLVGEKLRENAANTAEGAKNTVIASADAVTDAVTGKPRESINNVTNIVTDIDEPGFSVRPPSQNETREIVDNVSADSNANSKAEGSAAIAYSKDPADKVIASSKKVTKKFKPTIVEEKKKPRRQVAKKSQPKKAVKKAVKSKHPTQSAKAPVSKPAAPAQATKPKPSAPKAASTAAVTGETGNTPLGKYSVQLLATSSQSRAGKLADTMKSEGYKVFVTKTNSNNKILFRVRVGGHADRDTAVEAQESMKRRYEKNFFIQNSLVVSN